MSEAVRCSCGETLLDGMDDSHVTVGDDEFRFRRTTDYVGCAGCGTIYRVDELEPGVNQVGEQSPAKVADPLSELRRLSAELDEERSRNDTSATPEVT